MGALAEIDKLKELTGDWDSYGADPVALHAAEFAKAVVSEVSGPYAEPVVGPTADGGVALIWRRAGAPKVQITFSVKMGPRYAVVANRRVLEQGSFGHPKEVMTKLQQYFVSYQR